MKNFNLLPFFEADTGSNGQDTPAETTGQNNVEVEKEQTVEKTFTRDDLAKMMSAEKAKWEKEQEVKQEETKKLAKMNEQEKLQHQLEQKDAEIADLLKEKTLSEMKSEASKMLSDAELPFDDELLKLIVTDNAEATKQAVTVITSFASKIKKENARQDPPSEGGQFTAEKENNNSKAEMAKNNRIIK